MRIEEAEELGRLLGNIPDEELAPVLNLGSGSGAFRKHQQSHIDQFIFKPLRNRGMNCVHVDIREEEGIDLIGDLSDPEFQNQLRNIKPGCVLLNNFLEHVRDPNSITSSIETFLPSGGYAIVSVPFSYPYHLDPIDTGFRPSPEEIGSLFESCDFVEGKIVESDRYLDRLNEMPLGTRLSFLGRSALRLFTPFYQFDRWKMRFHRFLWLYRPYKVSLAVLRKR